MRPILALTAALALTSPALGEIRINPFNDQMRKLSPVDQAGALRRAVTLDDQACGRMLSGFYRGLYGNLGYWQARCKPGGDYAVFVGPGGEVQVRHCAEMKALKLPECKAFPK